MEYFDRETEEKLAKICSRQIAKFAQKHTAKTVTDSERLVRASDILSSAFLQFRRATWHNHFCEVLADKQQILIKDDGLKIGRWHGWWGHFPSDVKDAQTAAAVLTTLACHDIGHLTKLTEQLFEGVDVHLEEVLMRIKPPSRRTVITYSIPRVDLNDYDFWSIRVTLRSTGEQWSIHVCGAQYGMRKPGSPWILFAGYKVHKILDVKPFGTLAAYAAALTQTKGTKGLEADMQTKTMQAFHDAVDPAMAKKGLSWAKIVDKGEDDYRRHSEKVLRVGCKAMEEFVLSQHLTKRRLKAERYEKRHVEELEKEKKEICERVLGYVPMRMDRCIEGITWTVSGHEVPDIDETHVKWGDTLI